MFRFLLDLFSREIPKIEPVLQVSPTFKSEKDYVVLYGDCNSCYTPPKVYSSLPVQYALAFVDGKPVLMGKYIWSEGFSKQGHEWREEPYYSESQPPGDE